MKDVLAILFLLSLPAILIYCFWWDVYRHKADAQKKRMMRGFLITIAVGLFVITLFFHIVPSKGRIFAKSHPTFEHTLVTEDDLREFSERFNNASALEQVTLMTDPFYRKLIEEGLLIRERKSSYEGDKESK